MDYQQASDSEVQLELGKRLKRERLNANLSQEALAQATGLSRRTITNLENGKGGTLLSVLAVLRELKLLNRLDVLLPENSISPVQLARMKGKMRQRATGERGFMVQEKKKKWEWGE